MKARLTTTFILVAAIGAGGCEALVPLAISEATKGDGTDDVSSFEAPLTVELESVRGTIEGTTLSPEMLTPSGMRFGNSLQFDLAAQGEPLTMQLMVDSAESSSTNPYTGEGGGDFGGGRPAPPPEPGTGGFETGPGAFLTACGDGFCRDADDITVEIVQDAEGRRAVVDASWLDGDSVSMTFRYTEGD